MLVFVRTDQKGIEVQLVLEWQPFLAFIKALIATIVVTTSLLSSPMFAHTLGQLTHLFGP